MPPLAWPQTDRHTRLCHLVAAMHMEEACPRKRSVPSAWTMLKAEFGYVGTRQYVMDRATEDAQNGRFR